MTCENLPIYIRSIFHLYVYIATLVFWFASFYLHLSKSIYRVSSHEPSQNSLTFPWQFPDHFVVFPDQKTYRHFITALTLILQAIWQITHQK